MIRKRIMYILCALLGLAVGSALMYQDMKHKLASGKLECSYIEAHGQKVSFCYDPSKNEGGL